MFGPENFPKINYSSYRYIKMEIRYSSYTSKGLVRDHNEDSLICKSGDGRHMFAVADGMGGHFGGEIASGLLTEQLGEAWDSCAVSDKSFEETTEMIKTTVANANEEIYSKYSSEGKICGTTLALVTVIGNVISFMNTGDTRIYSLNGLRLRQESVDHVYYEVLKRSNPKAAELIRNDPVGSRLTSAIGSSAEYKLDIKTRPVTKETLFICSDGVYKFMPEHRMKMILMLNGKRTEKLVSGYIEKKGARDNYTFLRIDIDP